MRDQYAADVSDFLKFAFLRELAANDRSIGVGWYYNPANDGRRDGRHREYRGEPRWRALDAALFDALIALPDPPSVCALEKLQIWPRKTWFHRVPVPPSADRDAWASDMVSTLNQASIVFLDPDNGVGAASERHATVAEIAALRKPGRTVVLIKFPGRNKTHTKQIEEYHNSLRSGAGASSAVTVSTNVFVRTGGVRWEVPRTRWFTLVDADDQLTKRAEQFAIRLKGIDKCNAHFVRGPEIFAMSAEKSRDALLRLMGLLERALRAITPDQSTPFHTQIETHRGKFSDIAGITEARRVRNAVAHGEDVSDARSEEAHAIIEKALTEISQHCPQRLQTAMREAALSAPGAVTPNSRPYDAKKVPGSTQSSRLQSVLTHNVPKTIQEYDANADLTVCDWVYFATPSQEDWATTKAIVGELEMIIRPVYDSRNPPNAIANVKRIRQGHTILLVYGGKGEPYRPMFACTVIAAPHPVPHFEAFSFADESQLDRLKKSGYTPDPHLKRFTGISVRISGEHITGSIQKPTGNNTIRSWKEVEAYNAGYKATPDRHA